MKKTLNYQPNLNSLDIIKDEISQHREFFISGHPHFLIPDFNSGLAEIWISFLDYLEKEKDQEVYDQDGGEITSHRIINSQTGLTSCKYTAYGITFNEDDEPQDYDLDIEGYVVRDRGTHFVATKVEFTI